MAYDAFNRRVSKTVNGVTTSYIHDNDEVIADYVTGTVTAEYVYGQGLDEILLMIKPAGDYYYHYDGLGSVTEVASNIGTIAERYEYNAYGEPTIYDAADAIIPDSAIGNRYMFTGREWDQESHTYHYCARQYSPTLGRFLQRDPAGYYDSMNLYQYTGNNPVNWVDPSGSMARLCRIQTRGRAGKPQVGVPKIDMKDPATWPSPPVEGPFRVGEPSRVKPRTRGERSLYDKDGGEWRPQLPDKYHDPHWNYKPPGRNTKWQDISPDIT